MPAPARRRPFRATILICITLLASMITYFASDGGRFLVIADYRLAAMPLLFVGFVAICCALLATVATFITNGGAATKTSMVFEASNVAMSAGPFGTAFGIQFAALFPIVIAWI